MEMKQTRTGKHQIFFPHGFIDPLTGAKQTRFYVDDKHFDILKSEAEAEGVPIRRYVTGLLKDGKSPFAKEASEYAQVAGKRETVKVSIGIPYLIRQAEKTDFRAKWPYMGFEEWVQFFVWQDSQVRKALEEAFKGEQKTIEYHNPAFHDPDHNNGRHFSEFIETLSNRFFSENCIELNLFFTLKDGTAMLSKIEWAKYF